MGEQRLTLQINRRYQLTFTPMQQLSRAKVTVCSRSITVQSTGIGSPSDAALKVSVGIAKEGVAMILQAEIIEAASILGRGGRFASAQPHSAVGIDDIAGRTVSRPSSLRMRATVRLLRGYWGCAHIR